ncbi:MAG TPA: signal peptidase II, partial [Tabrizicola sp.]|nr:signal peptidase II [Tabrizicola sp.]
MLISLIAAAVVADQLTKTAALSLLSQGTAVPVLPGFNLSLGFNTGASFGMMGGVMAGKPLLMAALTGALT